MKFNKWTYGLAAVGAVSLASAARADEAKLNALDTALSNTTISGSVSFSAQVALDPNAAAYANSVAGSSNPFGGIPFQRGKQDGFNLDVVRLTIASNRKLYPGLATNPCELFCTASAIPKLWIMARATVR